MYYIVYHVAAVVSNVFLFFLPQWKGKQTKTYYTCETGRLNLNSFSCTLKIFKTILR